MTMMNALSQQQVQGDDYTPDDYIKTASFVYSDAYTGPIQSWLNASPGDRIIDLGCGSGELTVKIQNAVGTEGFILGVDYNRDMATKASKNGVEHTLVCDVQQLELPPSLALGKSFDAAFSNAALHWCKRDPVGVLEGLKRVLKPGGRFVCEMGGFMNCVGVRSALHYAVRKRGLNPEEMDPWYFPSVQEYQTLLQNAGFRVDTMSLVPRLTPLDDGGLRAWLQLFSRGTFLKTVNDADAEAILDEVEEMCRLDCQDLSGKWSLIPLT
ncbi:S-adenosyl-L-methionine-dependent methyltransferase [Boletus reticuloceps]|uniref:S-adenosyl-L-methionine-dependent methyltransferase n=1 Tax=Boletus reticuloceps TaxID=495285 RepID=A0A8I2YJ39_9AGAM|nr:S-adenosyl-L-methionine-dependent methyltransferase [Boletus reticuloceps]